MAVGLIVLSILCAAIAGLVSAATGFGNPWLITFIAGNAVPVFWLAGYLLTARDTTLLQEASVRNKLEAQP